MKSIFAATICIFYVVRGYNSQSCAYFSNHVLATPLTKCAAYSYQTTQYSWNFECDDAGNVNCNYFGGDTECGSGFAGSTGVDTTVGTVQCVGSGENCHTVDMHVKGFTDRSADSCNDPSDYFKFSFVIDECVPSTIGGVATSAILSCDAEKLYFEYYSGCKNCACDMETYTFEYYSQMNGCWDIICGTHEEEGVGTPSDSDTETPPETPPACDYVGHNNHHKANKLKELLLKPIDFTLAKYYTSKQAQFYANVLGEDIGNYIEPKVSDKQMMHWIYIVAAGCALILVVGLWRYIKRKEYTLL